MAEKFDLKGKKVVCLLSGGNIDVTILSKVINRGLIKAGRSSELNIRLMDRPGELKEISAIIADLGGNVVSVFHDRADEHADVAGCYLRIRMETRNWEHVRQIRAAIASAGYHICD
jgi:threonine dehydratase